MDEFTLRDGFTDEQLIEKINRGVHLIIEGALFMPREANEMVLKAIGMMVLLQANTAVAMLKAEKESEAGPLAGPEASE